MSDLSKKTLDQIETGNIRPYSIWRFRALKMLVWSMFVLSILTGSIGTAVAIFLVKNADWDLYRHFGHSLAEFSLLILPWFWILFICMFTLFAYYYFRKTGRGYKLNTIRVIFLSISLSVAIGTVLSLTTLPEKIESTFNKTLPWYTHMHRHRHTMWMNPEKGFLVGTIGQSTDTIIIITDLNGNTWQVDVSKTIWRGRTSAEPGVRIKIIGSQQANENQARLFKATEIRPWQGRGMRMMNGQKHEGKHGNHEGRGRCRNMKN